MHFYYNMAQVKTHGISHLNRGRLTQLHHKLGGAFSVDDAMSIWQTDRSTTRRRLAHLAAHGWLVRVQRGRYATIPLDAAQPGRWQIEPWAVASQVFAPCYVGGWSACEHWGLTEQIFRTVVVFSASSNLRERRPVIQETTYIVRQIPADRLFGARVVWLNQHRILVSDASRTLVDLLDDPAVGGGITHVVHVMHNYFQSTHCDHALLLDYAARIGNGAVYKRLGYLLEHLQIDAPDLIDACQTHLTSGYALLDPAAPAKGVRRRRWHLHVNITINPESIAEISPDDQSERTE